VTTPVLGSIRQRSTFRALSRPAGRAARGPIRVKYVPNPEAAHDPFVEVGFAISRHCGNAVVRNRLRRRLREVIREGAAELAEGAYLVTTDRAAADLEFARLRELSLSALRAAGSPAP